MVDFEILPHTADIKIRAYGKTKKDLFRNALIGMFQAIEPIAVGCHNEGGRVVCKELPEQHTIEVKASDEESLLVNFLSDALYLSDVHNEAYLDAAVNECTGDSLKATVYGVKITGFSVVEIKAVTYHELAIEKDNDGWRVDIVFDI